MVRATCGRSIARGDLVRVDGLPPLRTTEVERSAYKRETFIVARQADGLSAVDIMINLRDLDLEDGTVVVGVSRA